MRPVHPRDRMQHDSRYLHQPRRVQLQCRFVCYHPIIQHSLTRICGPGYSPASLCNKPICKFGCQNGDCTVPDTVRLPFLNLAARPAFSLLTIHHHAVRVPPWIERRPVRYSCLHEPLCVRHMHRARHGIALSSSDACYYLILTCFPWQCTCFNGYNGSTCANAIVKPGCVNGDAGGIPFGCVCFPGWYPRLLYLMFLIVTHSFIDLPGKATRVDSAISRSARKAVSTGSAPRLIRAHVPLAGTALLATTVWYVCALSLTRPSLTGC